MSLERPAKKGNKYINTIPTDEAGLDKMIPIMREYINNKAEVVPVKTMGPFKTDTAVYNTPPTNGLRVTWVGHSSLLIEIDGCTIHPAYGAEALFSATDRFKGPAADRCRYLLARSL
jgi:hypothetical protein